MLNYTTIEELKQIPISEIEKEINSENSLEFAYKYLGDPDVRIDYFNEEDYAVLQQRLAEMQG